jgi:hypothetical protein
LVKLAARKRPHGHAVRQRIEISARAAATQTQCGVSLIEHLRDYRTGGPAHRRRHTFIDSPRRLAEDEPLLSVSEQKYYLRVKRKVGEGTIDHLLYLALHHRYRCNLFFAHIVERAHGLKRLLKLALMGWRSLSHMVRMHSN